VTRNAVERAGEPRITAWRRLARNRGALAGLGFLALVAVVCLAAPILPLAEPNATDLSNRLLGPFAPGHPLGTDQLGRDLLARLVWGARVSVAIGFFATLIATVIGTLVGIVAGFYGKAVDALLMRSIDVLMAFPYLLLAIAIVAALGPGLRNAMIAISIVNIPFFARAVRGSTVSFKDRDFVQAARLSGYGNGRILALEIFPNVLPAIVIMMSTTVGWMILETAGLSFLGLGAQPPQADLGSMLGDGRKFVTTDPHVTTLPGLFIFAVVIGINLLGDGLRDVLDPKLKAEAAPGRAARKRPYERREASPARSRTARGGESASAAQEQRAEPALLEVEGLSTWFFVGDQVYRAVDGVSFRLGRGETLGVVGESGSGKTVTALSILGLVPDPPGRIVEGRIRLDGSDLVGAPERELRALRGNRITYVAQDPMTALNPLLKVGDQVTEVIRRHRAPGRSAARRRMLEVLEQVRLPDPATLADRYPHELSGGMRQRVVIAMAIANDPEVLIADEPTTALDVTTQKEILELLGTLRRERDSAMIFVTHDFGIVSEMCDRVAVMYAGKIVESAPLGTIFADPRHPYTRRLLEAVPVLGKADRSMKPIPGLPPPGNALPPGCRFTPRCELAIDRCGRSPVELDRIDEGHLARCVRAREDVVKGRVL
jgi:peptide/nickel transport system permease protein